MRAFADLPKEFAGTRAFYDRLTQKPLTLALKRAFDILASLVLLILLSPVFLALAILIKRDSPGPVFYRQVRVGRYGKPFRIFKFRTMREGADQHGPEVTVAEDPRITKMGHKLRGGRLDEFPQLINVLKGEMSFVGPRPEVPRYVAHYTSDMWGTLLVRPGVTAPASIQFKDENEILDLAEDPEKVYVEDVLPRKMKLNEAYVKELSLWGDIKILWQTVLAVA